MPLPLAGLFAGGLFAKILAFVLAGVVVRVVSAMGIAFIAFQGIDLLVTEIENLLSTGIASLGSTTFSLMELGGFIYMLEIVVATICGVLTIKALTATKRLVFR